MHIYVLVKKVKFLKIMLTNKFVKNIVLLTGFEDFNIFALCIIIVIKVWIFIKFTKNAGANKNLNGITKLKIIIRRAKSKATT